MVDMSYVVLARKYRPRSFAQMVGQEHVVQALTNALTQGRLHHAYLFTGTRGIGKTTVSRILAKSLNCTGADGLGGITATPCGVCQACTEIDADRYIDYVEMDAASNGGKDEIRELIERAAYKPGVGRFKVFMIDEAHQLSRDAFNALLKTLEEPPAYLKFVLATTDPNKVLPTVLSRCLQFNLRPMAPATVREHLATVLAAEGIEAESGALRLLARAARGSMRDGLSLTDQAIAYGGGRLVEEVVRAMLGAVDRGHVVALVEALARRDAAGVLGGVDALRAAGLSADAALEELAQLLQQMAIEQAVPGALEDSEPETEAVRALAPLLAADETQLLYRMALQGREELSLMADEHGALAMVLLRFLAFPPAGHGPTSTAARPPMPLRAPAPPTLAVVPGPAGRREGAESPMPERRAHDAVTPSPVMAADTLSAAAVPVSRPPLSEAQTSTFAPDVGEPTNVELADRWQTVVQSLIETGNVAALLRELAWQAGLVAVDASTTPPTWRLAVAREPLRSPVLAEKLALALTGHLGEPVQVAVVAGEPTDTPATRETASRAHRQAAAEITIHADPVVRELLLQFKGARIVPGSIRPA
jgi:DNA polymerase-3 subunit gamma/tau